MVCKLIIKTFLRMEKIYQKPVLRAFNLHIEGMICLSPGKVGGDGEPGAGFDPSDGDIYDGGNY